MIGDGRQTGESTMIDVTAKLPASLEAIRAAAATAMASIDQQRAETFVQQVTNEHGDDDICQIREGVPVTYSERFSELDRFENNLKNGLPPVVIEALSD